MPLSGDSFVNIAFSFPFVNTFFQNFCPFLKLFFEPYILCLSPGHTTYMSTIGFFHRSKRGGQSAAIPYHPEKNPRFPAKISAAALQKIFADCADFSLRGVWPGGQARPGVSLCWLDGLVSGQTVSAEVLRPLTDDARLGAAGSARECAEELLHGAVWCAGARRRTTLDALAEDLLNGWCAVIFDALGEAVCFEAKSTNLRSVDTPTVEKSIKGGKDAFVEALRTNTALVRRRVRDPALKLAQTCIGRKSATAVGIFWLEGVANPETLALLRARLDAIDIDGFVSAGNLEPYLVDRPNSPFPQLLHTERSDKFASELLAGRIGILVDGLPLGFLLPATLAHFMKVAEDKAQHFLIASGLTLLRWLSTLLSLLFPAVFVAVCMYHQEMIPTKLLLSMIEAKQQVPFSVAFEVLTMLVAFELLLEAGIRLPDPVGDTVSIIGALIVGQSAVEARIVSPISVIVVATAAICGFTQPSRDMGAALRLLRVGMVFLAIVLGLFGIAIGCALLVWYLCTLESFGVPYVSPMGEGGWREVLHAFVRPPMPSDKLRERALRTPDKRSQK